MKIKEFSIEWLQATCLFVLFHAKKSGIFTYHTFTHNIE